jgi:hypothetical protein
MPMSADPLRSFLGARALGSFGRRSGTGHPADLDAAAEAGSPDRAMPETAAPDMVAPDMAAPDMAAPDMATSDTARSLPADLSRGQETRADPRAADPRAADPRTADHRLPDLVLDALEVFAPLGDDLRALDGALAQVQDAGDRDTAQAARRLRQMARAFEPSVTMIGQVKAGKTSLVNAMIGHPGLLPADVNPWTSVVTSLHLSSRPLGAQPRARFRFFTDDEWSRLVDRGGRLGELADRAGAGDELDKVRAQLAEMREKSKRRLGRKFEMLMGQEHDYAAFDDDLIQRYVCLGDEDDGAAGQGQGRFADITKSADLWLHAPGLPVNLCLRDTPGVNDTFMIREQITLHAIRDSRLCVVVLSAAQALSTVDMALIRLISNVRAREVVIFVNRVDELADPVGAVPEIEASVRATLRALNGPADAEIVFGSAAWAQAALQGGLADLPVASAESLVAWAEARMPEVAPDDTQAILWQLSGVPRLMAVLAERTAAGQGAEMLRRVSKSAMNLGVGIAARDNVVALRVGGTAIAPVDPGQLSREIDAIAAHCRRGFEAALDRTIDDFRRRLDRTHAAFLDRATAELVRHLETFGDDQVWTYDPAGLRMLMRTSYQVFAAAAGKATVAALTQARDEVRGLYLRSFRLPEAAFALEVPDAPAIPAPVMLGQTIALDLKGNWWSRWWRRQRSYRAFADDFRKMIAAETQPIVTALYVDHAGAIRTAALDAQAEFLAEQKALVAGLTGDACRNLDDLRGRLERPEDRARRDDLAQAVARIAAFVA